MLPYKYCTLLSQEHPLKLFESMCHVMGQNVKNIQTFNFVILLPKIVYSVLVIELVIGTELINNYVFL